jgi:hypothetical protein
METTKRDLEKEVEARVKDELDPIDTEELYDQMLDDCYEPFMGSYDPSRVLKEIDPTAYRCGLNDYVDSISRDSSFEEIDEELYEAREVQAIRDEIQAEIDEDEAEDEDDDDN